jgi:hypothetical protein
MSEDLFCESTPFCLIKRGVEAEEAAAALEAVAGHLELVHGMHILNVHFD